MQKNNEKSMSFNDVVMIGGVNISSMTVCEELA